MGLGNRESYKAATAFAGGIARMGETCGSLTGGIMAVSLAFGRAELENSATSTGYLRAMEVSKELYQQFEKEFGSTKCRDIQKLLFGRSFDMWDAREREQFQKAGSHEKCALVVKKAAQLTATVILKAGYYPPK